MNEQEQIALFKRVQARFRRWSGRQCSGYIHGIVDEGHLPEPQAEILNDQTIAYNISYVYGFVDARGKDALTEDWYKLRSLVAGPFKCDYRWWDK